MARSRFLYGLDQTPDDRLNWSPGGSAKSPLGLADRITGFLQFISQLIETGEMPDRSAPQPAPSESREEAKARVAAGFDRALAVLEGLTEADLQKLVPVPWGARIPVLGVLGFFPTATGYFQGQLNYCQLAYGDEDPNIPPDWRPADA
jgi:hypothetical protein